MPGTRTPCRLYPSAEASVRTDGEHATKSQLDDQSVANRDCHRTYSSRRRRSRVLLQIRSEMKARLAITQDILGDYDLRTSETCFHVWLTLPDHLRLGEFVASASAEGISLKSAELFVPPGGAVPPAIRLSVSSPTNRDVLKKGLMKIKELLEQEPMGGFAL